MVISIGAMLFGYFYSEGKEVERVYGRREVALGYVLVVVAMASKGLFSDNKAYCTKEYQASPYHVLYTVSLVSSVLSLLLLSIKAHLTLSL